MEWTGLGSSVELSYCSQATEEMVKQEEKKKMLIEYPEVSQSL